MSSVIYDWVELGRPAVVRTSLSDMWFCGSVFLCICVIDVPFLTNPLLGLRVN